MVTSTSTTNDFSEAAGLSFSAYSADHLAALLRIWVEHSWPISKEEAFNLCDRCGWTMMQGDDESFTTSIQSANYNQFDGSVRYDANDPGFISGIDSTNTNGIDLTNHSYRQRPLRRVPECHFTSIWQPHSFQQ